MSAFRVAVVDAFGTSFGFTGAFGALGGEVIQVRSTPAPPEGVDPVDDRAFSHVLVHDGELDSLTARLGALGPVAVLPGRETGVELADALSERLGLPSNGTALSTARRDKYVQIETIKACGVPGMRQLRTGDEAELLAWQQEFGGRVVVKPLRGYWGADVSFCDRPQDSVAALRGLRSRRTVLGETITEVVAQEYLVGTEYILNTVSCAGVHRLTDAWRTERIQANGVRDLVTAQVLLRSDEQPVGELFDYGRRVLDALGIRYGAAHLEIKLTPDGPRLVEAGARVSGLPHYTAEVLGEGQLEWTVDAYVRPERFRARAGRPYRRRHVRLGGAGRSRVGTAAGLPRARPGRAAGELPRPHGAGEARGRDHRDHLRPRVPRHPDAQPPGGRRPAARPQHGALPGRRRDVRDHPDGGLTPVSVPGQPTRSCSASTWAFHSRLVARQASSFWPNRQ